MLTIGSKTFFSEEKLDGLFLYLESMKRERLNDEYCPDVAKLKRLLGINK